MTALAAPSLVPSPAPAGGVLRLVGAHGGRSTLEDVVSGVWEDLAAGRPAGCPVCTASMRRTASGDAACGACGSRLS